MRIYSINSHIDNKNKISSNKKVSFGINRISDKFPCKFLRSVRNYGLPCPICGGNMISLDIFNLPAGLTLKFLELYKQKMTDVNKLLLSRLKAESVKYPELTVKDLLAQMKPQAQRAVGLKRVNVLNEFLKDVHRLPADRKKLLAGICNRFLEIENQNLPEKEKFNTLFNIEISKFMEQLNHEQRVYYEKIRQKMPNAKNNVNSAIIEYLKRAEKSSLIDIYRDPFAVMGHVKAYSKGGDIVMWMCDKDNTWTRNFPLNLLAKEYPPIIENMKAQVTRLLEIYKDTLGKTSETFSNQLKEYIIAVNNSIREESKGLILPDISEILK